MKMHLRSLHALFVIALLLFAPNAAAQNTSQQETLQYNHPPLIGLISTTLAPDARAAGMGEVGVATTADAYALYHNVSKLAFAPQRAVVSASYLPWMRSIIGDMGVSTMAGFYAWTHKEVRHAVTAGLKYFDIGKALVIPRVGNADPLPVYPYELTLDMGYALSLSPHWSIGIGAKYAYSDLNVTLDNIAYRSSSFLYDLSATYARSFKSSGHAYDLVAALALNNLGSRISYNREGLRLFAPTLFRMGIGVNTQLARNNRLALTLEVDKLLAPRMPAPTDVDYEAYATKLRNLSAIQALFYSFADTTGGLAEELRELSLALGGEYAFDDFITLRAGLRYQHPAIGNTSGLFAGAGLKLSGFDLDLSYFTSWRTYNPLNNTARVSLSYSF